MSFSFLSIKAQTEGLFKDRGSKFFGFAFPVSSTEDVKLRLEEIKALHPTARHICYAYLLGENADEYRANDDGEPNGSAGLPILNQIKSNEVTNVLVAVIRYFGGTKLGVSGLINAYKEAATLALSKAKVIEVVPMASIHVKFPHSSIGEVERIVRQNCYSIVSQEFSVDCKWTISCKRENYEECQSALSLVTDVVLLTSTKTLS